MCPSRDEWPIAAISRGLRRSTVTSLGLALVLGTAIVVAGSDFGFRDVGKGIWWYEYFPFYSHGHGDGISYPLMLPIYLNLAAVTAAAYVPVRLGERLVRTTPGEGATISIRRLAATLALIGLLGLPVLSGFSALAIVTLLLSVLFDVAGLYGPLPESEFGMNSAVLTPTAAVGWVLCYGLVTSGGQAVRRIRTRV